MTRPDSTPLLASIHVPTLIVVGDEDTMTPPAVAEEMQPRDRRIRARRAFPRAGICRISSSPDAFNAALAQFLEHRV